MVSPSAILMDSPAGPLAPAASRQASCRDHPGKKTLMFVPSLHPSPLRKQGSSLFHLFSGFLLAQERRDVIDQKTPENESPELLPGAPQPGAPQLCCGIADWSNQVSWPGRLEI